MYQASEVEQFAPGHHGYPRASEACGQLDSPGDEKRVRGDEDGVRPLAH